MTLFPHRCSVIVAAAAVLLATSRHEIDGKNLPNANSDLISVRDDPLRRYI